MSAIDVFAPSERVPDLARGYVRRTRLDSLLDLASDRALILIEAPAGFGKTQLLVHWRRLLLSAGVVTIWCDAHGSPAESLASLAARGYRDNPGRYTAPAAILDSRSVPTLVSQLRAASRRFAILIDDLEAITDAKDRATWCELLSLLPVNCQIICATRGESLFPVEEARAYGQATIIDANDLQFTGTESRSMLREAVSNVDADPATDALADALEGWPIALAAAVAALGRGAEPDDLLQDLNSGLPEVTFLLKSTIAALSPRLHDILLPLAILDTIDLELAEAATGMPDAADCIAALRCTTPIFPPSSTTPRLRRIVRRLLLNTDLDPANQEQMAVHRRAADWLAENGRPSGAILHFLAIGRVDRACEMLDSCLFETVSGGGIVLALDWLRAVPSDQISESLRANAAWAAAVGGDTAAIDRFLPVGGEGSQWRDTISAQQRGVMGALLAAHADDADVARDCLAADLDWTAMSMPFCIVRHNLLSWLAQQSGVTQAEPIAPLDAWRHVPLRSANFYAYSFSIFREAVVRLGAGRSRSAAEIVRPVLDQADSTLGPDTAPSIQLCSILAAAYHQHGDHTNARAVLAGRLLPIEAHAMPEALWLGLSTAANLAAEDGDMQLAIDLLERLKRRAARRSLLRVETLACAEQAKLLIRCGRRASALSPLLHAMLDRIGADQGIRATNVRLAATMGIARIACNGPERDTAHGLLTEAEAIASALRRKLDIANIWLLRLRLNGGNTTTQLGAIRASGLIDDGDLEQLAEENRIKSMDERLATISVKRPRSRCEPRIKLTQREQDIVELLAHSLSNRAISETLCLGEETIKWHLKNLFVKLDVHDRRSVVSKAIASR